MSRWSINELDAWQESRRQQAQESARRVAAAIERLRTVDPAGYAELVRLEASRAAREARKQAARERTSGPAAKDPPRNRTRTKPNRRARE